MLELKHLSKSYPGKRHALKDLSLTLPRGEIVGLLGENGAGKTIPAQMHSGADRFRGKSSWTVAPSPERTMPNCPLPPVSTPSFPPSPPRPTGIFTPGIFPGSGRPAMTG